MILRLRLPLLLLLAASSAAQAQAQVSPPAPPAPAPQAQQPPPRLDQQAIRDAVKATVEEMPPLPPADARPDFSAGPSAPGGRMTQAQIDQAFVDAVVESCWGSGALKHTPPVLSLGGLPLALGGLLAVPHVFYAAASGKCK